MVLHVYSHLETSACSKHVLTSEQQVARSICMGARLYVGTIRVSWLISLCAKSTKDSQTSNSAIVHIIEVQSTIVRQ